jgi:cobaltochelatase CobT
VADNLTAMLEDKYQRGKLPGITSREDAPLEEALALMVREKLPGRHAARIGGKVVDMWRDFIEDKAGSALRRSGGVGR